MNAPESTNTIMIALTILAGSTCGLIMMVIWLIGLVRELRTDLQNQRALLVESRFVAGQAEGQLVGRQEGRDEIRALTPKDAGLTHTDELRP